MPQRFYCPVFGLQTKTRVNERLSVDVVDLDLIEPVAGNGITEGRYRNCRVKFKLEKYESIMNFRKRSNLFNSNH